MKEIVKAGQRFRRREFASADAARAGAGRRAVQARADRRQEFGRHVRGHGGRRGRPDDLRQPRPQDGRGVLVRPVPRPAPATRPSTIPAFKLLRYGRGLLARQREEPAAPAHLRHGLGHPRRAEGAPPPAGGGGQARPPPHRRAARAVHLRARRSASGLPLWLPNGTVIRDELEGWARETERRLGYKRVVTPHLAKEDLYYLSGHLPYYTEDLYAPIEIEDETYYLRPMNCPHHHMVYRSRPSSYRELPYKLAEYGTVYRYERSGQLLGTMRTRGFTQNDAHIYCTYDQAKEEFLEVMRMHDAYYTALGITDFYMVLALRDPDNKEKYHDDEAMWQQAEAITREAMDESGIPYVEDDRRRRPLRAEGRLHHPVGDRPASSRPRPTRSTSTRRSSSSWRTATPSGGESPGRGHPPRAARQPRAVHGLPHRALRRRLPRVAGARAGAGHPGHARADEYAEAVNAAPARRGPALGGRRLRRPAGGQGPHRGRRARCRSSWWWAGARPTTARSPCGCGRARRRR